MRINKERVVQQFYDLIAIPCPSTQERQVADYLIREMEALGGTVTEDNAAAALQGTTGNLFINFPGTVEGVPKILLSAHLDCVNPCAGIQATLEDGVFRSDGATILGGDDKSGVTAILETLRCLKEQNIPHGPLQVVFTVCEEQGVAGSRNMDASLLDADFGYCLDSSGHPGKIIFAAPGQNKIFTKVHGKTAHGGLAPEKGINAIKKAAEILLDVPTARIDEETTCNIGIIHGGTATNVVPDLVEIAMDCRSRNLEKLEALTERIVAAYQEGGKKAGVPVDVEVRPSYKPYELPKDSPCILLAAKAAEELGLPVDVAATGGGSDSSHFNGNGVPCTVLGTGMTNVHTVEEILLEKDLYDICEWTLSIVADNAKKQA
ncbi:MAG: M20/M25/M40 family metallo-hydrolase [Succiniclasticum sp.]|nr:M20/M25/M40 family metallo-hydrolase [Succiniclasticum sp.]MDY6303316.1 M20/M25/M40 family metallo-hydrolase [Succiniclasticum sp.]MDY6345763.1 M20/M25/M40 family metallo-hydrolase [Succiniclasticum sp.]